MFAADWGISRFVAGLLCGIHCILTPGLAAADADWQQAHHGPMDFSLWFSSTTIDFQTPARQAQLNLDRVGFALREQAVTGFRYALLLGYAFSDDSEQAETQGLDLAGQYIGVELAYPILSAPSLNRQTLEILGSGRFIYQRTEAATALQTVSQRWRESALGLSLWYRVNVAVAVVLEAAYLDVGVAQQASGQITRNSDLANQTPVERRIGLDFFTGAGGWVGVYGSFGYSRGLQLKFQRKF